MCGDRVQEKKKGGYIYKVGRDLMFDMSQLNTKQSNEIALKKKAKKKTGSGVRVNIMFENPPIMENCSEPEFNASTANTKKKKKRTSR